MTNLLQTMSFLILLAACSANTGEFVLTNDSKEVIRHAHVEISGEVFDLEEIRPQDKRVGLFKVSGDSHYEISIIFESGKKLHEETGYVTRGFDYKHTIVVTETGISISGTEIK